MAQGIGFNRRTIYRWLADYHYGGEEALTAKPIPGAPQKLDARRMQQLSRIIREKNPLQLKFDYALWTLAIIRELIVRRFKVKLSEVSVGRVMKRLGFSAQRPLYRAWQQDPALAQSWQDQEYPKIAARAKKEKAVIFFADEVRHSLGPSRGHDMGADRTNARGQSHRGAVLVQHVVGGERQRTVSIHDGGRQRQRDGVSRVS